MSCPDNIYSEHLFCFSGNNTQRHLELITRTDGEMADTEEWFVGEDGCLSVGKPTHSVTYHTGLNTILVSTKEPSVNVIDVTSGSILQKSDLSGMENDTASFFNLSIWMS